VTYSQSLLNSIDEPNFVLYWTKYRSLR